MKKSFWIGFLLLLGGMLAATESSPLWMRYPSLSPDGKTIVFSFRDDLYRVSAKGGQAQPLTAHEAYDYAPVWSPDGRSIAFASNRYGNFDVFIMPSEGGEPVRLTFHSANQVPTSFTPDGRYVLFSATMADDPRNAQFPSGILSELYRVPVDGGRVEQVLTTPAEEASYDSSGAFLVYQDRKGYENIWRKHHTSSVARDIWLYRPETGNHTRLTSFAGEDRSPVLSSDGRTLYYLSERSGSFNVWSSPLDNPESVTQLTFFEKHPVRFLSMSREGTLCFGFDGELYTCPAGGKPCKVPVSLAADRKENPETYMTLGSDVDEMSLSPDGKEVAVIIRGEVYVSSVEHGTTRRITCTPEQERSVSYSPDGRSLLYASERNGSWNLYQTRLARSEENHFFRATLLKEEPVLEIPEETFQPSWSPDGGEVAFLEERTTLKVINLKTRQIRTILPGTCQYSYADGDQWYQWSPDGKWFLVQYFSQGRWSSEAGLVSANGDQKLINLTRSGYEDAQPRWMMGGKMMIWASDRFGMRSHGGFGREQDVFGLFFSREAMERFRLSEEEFDLLKEQEKKEKERKKAQDEKPGKGRKAEAEGTTPEPLKLDLVDLEDRKVRLTLHSSDLSDALMDPEGEKLYYLSRFEKGYDLWVQDFRKHETRLLVKLDGRGGALEMDREGKMLLVLSGGRLQKIGLPDGKRSPIGVNAGFTLNAQQERAGMFEHVWREVKKKFYDPQLHGVDWDYYKKTYARFLPWISNNFDFAEMLSELLGELNGSHTGSGYTPQDPSGDSTASLGMLFDQTWKGDGLKIQEVLEKSPVLGAQTKVKNGVVLVGIDGTALNADLNPWPLLHHREGCHLLLTFRGADGKTWDEVVKPISRREESELLYQRWVKARRTDVERLSGGRLGYVHVRGMDGASYRVIFDEIFGRYTNVDALVVDTRFNGGGNLVEELTTLLSGRQYLTNIPRGQKVGIKPEDRWTKPSIVLISESNYSDAHGFPYGYKTLGIGELVGMPVPGTMTSVWWETLQDPTLYFGIPEVGKYDLKGHYLENQQLEPDHKVANDYAQLAQGRDQQLEAAVQIMLRQLDQKKQ